MSLATTTSSAANNKTLLKLKSKAAFVQAFARSKKLSTHYCFLLDLSQPSGKNRFFIYDLVADTIIASGLVAHGSCNTNYLQEASFSNTPGCGCSSIGRYKTGGKYKGRFGTAYKLIGLDSSNSNAFKRNVVLHAYRGVPASETYPQPICNSLGCPMVSYQFLTKVASVIDASPKPLLLWIFN